MKLSVIIPAYNVEQTLRRCVDSVLSQRVEGMEVIIINDGSRDGTKTIANELEREYDCVKLITQPNGGLSDARNSGINIAQGEYITFVDSDDYIETDTYQPLTDILDKNPQCDFLEYSFRLTDRNKTIASTALPSKTYNNFRDYWFRGEAYRHTYACNKIFRRRIFFDGVRPLLRFAKGKVFEDVHFLCELMTLNPIMMMTTPLGEYVYEKNPKGITHSATGKDLEQLLSAHIAIANKLQLSFMQQERTKRRLPQEEEEYYTTVANIQISVCRQTGARPLLPSAVPAIHLRDVITPKKLMKKIILRLGSIEMLCRC